MLSMEMVIIWLNSNSPQTHGTLLKYHNFRMETRWHDNDNDKFIKLRLTFFQGLYKVILDGTVLTNEINEQPMGFTNVKLYKGSPNEYTNGVSNPSTPDIDFEYFTYTSYWYLMFE